MELYQRRLFWGNQSFFFSFYLNVARDAPESRQNLPGPFSDILPYFQKVLSFYKPLIRTSAKVIMLFFTQLYLFPNGAFDAGACGMALPVDR